MTQIVLYQVAKWIKGVSKGKSFLRLRLMSTFMHFFFDHPSASNSDILKNGVTTNGEHIGQEKMRESFNLLWRQS